MWRHPKASDPIEHLSFVVHVHQAEHGRQVLDFSKPTIGWSTDHVQWRKRIVSFPFQFFQLTFKRIEHLIRDIRFPLVVIKIIKASDLRP
ncbi:hypothetical protein D9M69_386980 [compost metagenome]